MPEILKVYGPMLALVILGFVAAYQFVDPAPPRHLTIATGDPGGTYHALGKRYQDILGEDGIDVTLITTAGSVDNLALFGRSPAEDAREPRTDIAFVQSGVGSPTKFPDLVSLASLYHEPLWIFVRSEKIPRRLTELSGKRVAIGTEGSGTRHVALQLLTANGIVDGDGNGTSTVDLGGIAAAEALAAGEVDAAFFVIAAQNPTLEELSAKPDIFLMSLDRAEAYTRRYRYLSSVLLPEGVLDLANNVPEEDIVLLSPVATLVARNDVHPALVDLVMQAATRIHDNVGIFEGPNQFPSPLNLDFPLSPEAERYFESGLGFLRRIMPFWAATIVERLWVMILPVLTLLIPLLRIAPPTYRWQVRRRIVRWYRDLRSIEATLQAAVEASDETSRADTLMVLDRLQNEVGQISVPLSYTDDLYNLRLHIDFIRRRFAAHSDRGSAVETSHD